MGIRGVSSGLEEYVGSQRVCLGIQGRGRSGRQNVSMDANPAEIAPFIGIALWTISYDAS